MQKWKNVLAIGLKELTNNSQEMRKKKSDDRKQLLIRYKIDEKGRISFIDPCCDEIPILLFGKIMEALSDVENEWNFREDNKRMKMKKQ